MSRQSCLQLRSPRSTHRLQFSRRPSRSLSSYWPKGFNRPLRTRPCREKFLDEAVGGAEGVRKVDQFVGWLVGVLETAAG